MNLLRIFLIAVVVVSCAFVVSACADAECGACGHVCCMGMGARRSLTRLIRRLTAAGLGLGDRLSASVDGIACGIAAFGAAVASSAILRPSVALRI